MRLYERVPYIAKAVVQQLSGCRIGDADKDSLSAPSPKTISRNEVNSQLALGDIITRVCWDATAVTATMTSQLIKVRD